MSYRDVQYLILILSTIPFDFMESHFAVELIVFELHGQTSVPFFYVHTLCIQVKLKWIHFADADDEVVVAKLSTSVLEDRKGSLFDQNIGPPLDQTQLRNYKTIEQILVSVMNF